MDLFNLEGLMSLCEVVWFCVVEPRIISIGMHLLQHKNIQMTLQLHV